MPEETDQRLLRAASDLMGMRELSLRLDVPEARVQAWISGETAMPNSALMKLSKVLDAWSSSQKPK